MYRDVKDVLERRYKMCSYIKLARITHYEELSRMFGISQKSIKKALDFIEECLGLILERKPGNGGYIKIAEGYKRGIVVFNKEETGVMVKACNELEGETKRELLNILIKHVSVADAANVAIEFIEELDEFH